VLYSIVYEPRTRTNLGPFVPNGGTKIAADSLIAQLHSQSKLATLRRENQKIQHENEIITRARSVCVGISDLSNDTKKHTTTSHETIP
jgi:hypothetical protein